MRLALTGRHVDVTPSLRQLVTRRLARLERTLNDHALSTQVVLTLEKRHHTVEITVHARGDHIIAGKGSAASWPQALSEAVEKVMQQALKVKEKWITRKRRAAGVKALGDGTDASTAIAAAPADDTPGRATRVAPGTPGTARRFRVELPPAPTPRVRATRYAVKPMSLADAATRLESGREPFVLFRHAETERLAIIYQRPDGRLGLIDPES